MKVPNTVLTCPMIDHGIKCTSHRGSGINGNTTVDRVYGEAASEMCALIGICKDPNLFLHPVRDLPGQGRCSIQDITEIALFTELCIFVGSKHLPKEAYTRPKKQQAGHLVSSS